MIPHPFTKCLGACLLLAGLATASRAMTAAELSQRLKAGEVIQLIDLRSKSRFEAGSIPGAMCIPASVILEKAFPVMSPAVLFDDGLGGTDAADIAATINQRPGWKAEVLEGGFAAWLALSGAPLNSPAGLHAEPIHHITYENLSALRENVVLVDLRPVDPETAGSHAKAALGKKPASSSAPDPVTDFCNNARNRSYHRDLESFRKQFQAPRQSTRKNSPGNPAPRTFATPPLVVLIDSVNADPHDTVRKLRSEGYTRVLVLAGGDESILLQGRRGKGRVAGSIGQSAPADPTPQTKPAKP